MIRCPRCKSDDIIIQTSLYINKDFKCDVCGLYFDHYEIVLNCNDRLEKDNKNTKDDIETLFNNFKDFLKEKNSRYGDAALNPINIFSKVDVESQIANRLDDKLSRIKNSDELRKNDVCDAFGYIALLMILNNWLEFDDLLD